MDLAPAYEQATQTSIDKVGFEVPEGPG